MTMAQFNEINYEYSIKNISIYSLKEYKLHILIAQNNLSIILHGDAGNLRIKQIKKSEMIMASNQPRETQLSLNSGSRKRVCMT